MRALITLILPLTAVAWLSPATSAQPVLTVSPDTLLYPDEDTITATNTGPEILAITEFSLGEEVPYIWEFEVEVGDDVYRVMPFYGAPPPPIRLAPGEVALIRVLYVDTCPVCSGGGGEFEPDTLSIVSRNAAGEQDSDAVLIDLSRLVSAEDEASAARPFALEPAYPNPAHSSVAVPFVLPEAADVRVAVYDVLGRQVLVLAERRYGTGRHTARFDGSDLAGGSYLVRVALGGGTTALSQPFVVAR